MKYLLLLALIFTSRFAAAQEPEVPENTYLHYTWRMFYSMSKIDSACHYKEAYKVLMKAVNLEKSGYTAEAIDSYKQLTAIQKNLFRSHDYEGAVPERIAALYARQNKYEQAITYYDSLVTDYTMFRSCGNGYESWLEHVWEKTAFCFNQLGLYDSVISRYTHLMFSVRFMYHRLYACDSGFGYQYMKALTSLYSAAAIRQALQQSISSLKRKDAIRGPGFFSFSTKDYISYGAPFFNGVINAYISRDDLSKKQIKEVRLLKMLLVNKTVVPSCGYQMVISLPGTPPPDCGGDVIVSR